MNASLKYAISFLTILQLLIGCSKPQPEQGGSEGTDEATVQPEGGKTVKADTAKWCDEVICTGRVDAPPTFQAAVHAPLGGFIRLIRHLPGDAVKQGEQLAVLEHQDIIALQEDYLNAVARLDLLEKADNRNTLLAAADAVPAKQQEETWAEKRALQVRKSSLASKLRLLGLDPKHLETSGTLVASIPIMAPISGYLVSVNAVQGQFVSPNERLFSLVDDNKIHISLQVMAKDAGRVKEGQFINYRVTGDSALHLGEIHRVNKAVDPEKGVVEVHAHDELTRRLTFGAYVNAQICTGTRVEVTIPAEAILGESEDRWVWLKSGTTFKKQPVKLGQAQKGRLSVREGIQAGDEVWVP